MPSFFALKFKIPTTTQAVLLSLVLLVSTVDSTRFFSIGGVSGLGALSLAAGGAVWAAWLIRPILPSGLLIIFLPLIFFGMDAIGTLLWYHPGMDGVQLLVVSLTFLGTMMLSARETTANPSVASQMRWALLIGSLLPVLVWLTIFLAKLLKADEDNASRGFALYAMVIAAVALATWREYSWPELRRGERAARRLRWKWLSLWPMLYAVLIAYVVLMGMSRTALVAIAMLIPLSLIFRGSVKSVSQGIVMLAIGGGIFAAILFNYQPLYDRFFKEDASMKVGGVSINATGRTKIWDMLLTSIGDDWVFGKGISASEYAVSASFHNVSQPHNDYIRFYYDQGVLGLTLWLIFVSGFAYRTIANMRRSIKNRSPDYSYHLAALLALTAVSFSMLTDNSYCYAFVMVPLAIVMGCSLGLGRFYLGDQISAAPALEGYSDVYGYGR